MALLPTLRTALATADRILITWFHNPVVSSTAYIVLYLYIRCFQLSAAGLDLFSPHELAWGLLHHSVDLIFIMRFAPWTLSLQLDTGMLSECALLLAQLTLVAAMYLWPQYLLFNADISPMLKLVLWWQIMGPLIIFGLTLADRTKCVWRNEPVCKSYDTHLALIKDTNNNLLPVMMIHLFAAIATSAPGLTGFLALLATYSLKLYLIHRFIIYTLVVVVCEEQSLPLHRDDCEKDSRVPTPAKCCQFLIAATSLPIIGDAVLLTGRVCIA